MSLSSHFSDSLELRGWVSRFGGLAARNSWRPDIHSSALLRQRDSGNVLTLTCRLRSEKRPVSSSRPSSRPISGRHLSALSFEPSINFHGIKSADLADELGEICNRNILARANVDVLTAPEVLASCALRISAEITWLVWKSKLSPGP